MDLDNSIKLFTETASAMKTALINYKKDSRETKAKSGYYGKKLEYFKILYEDIKKFSSEILKLDTDKKHDFHTNSVENVYSTPEEFLIEVKTHFELLQSLNISNQSTQSFSGPTNVSTSSSIAQNMVNTLHNINGKPTQTKHTDENKNEEISKLLNINEELSKKYNSFKQKYQSFMVEFGDLKKLNNELRVENHKIKLENLLLKSESDNVISTQSTFNQSFHTLPINSNKVSDILKLIPKFNGKPEELRVYINKIDDLFSYINDGDEAIFVTVVKTNLTGEAALEILDEEGLDSWNELKSKLLTSFKNQENHVNDIALLQQMKQCENENVETFCNRIKKVLSKLKSVIPLGATRNFWFAHTEGYAVQCLEDGLMDVTVQARLIAQKPPNFQSAVQFAIDTDNRLKKNVDNSSNKTNDTKSKLFCRYCKKNNHVIENCKLRSKNRDQKGDESKSEEYKCTICKKNTHSTDICYNNPKNKQKSAKEANANSLVTNERNDDELELWTESEN
jgi:hypothetical protein